MKIRKLLAFVVAALALPALALASTQATSPVVSSKLKGSNEVPAKGDPDGTGFVVVTFKAAKGQACWQFKGISKIGAPNAAHIHKGRSGVAGPVVIPLGSGEGLPVGLEEHHRGDRDEPESLLREPAQREIPGRGAPRPTRCRDGGLTAWGRCFPHAATRT